jgi:hypothetical protein
MLSVGCLFSYSSNADSKYCAEFTNAIYSKDIQQQALAVYDIGNAVFKIREFTGGDKAPTDKNDIMKSAALALTGELLRL